MQREIKIEMAGDGFEFVTHISMAMAGAIIECIAMEQARTSKVLPDNKK